MSVETKGCWRFKHNVIVSSVDGEGMILDLDSLQTFWLNQTGVFIVELLRENDEGADVFSIKDALQVQFKVDTDNDRFKKSVNNFLEQLEAHGLVTYIRQTSPQKRRLSIPSVSDSGHYEEPVILEMTVPESVENSSRIRAARQAAVRSQAMRQATRAGFRPRA